MTDRTLAALYRAGVSSPPMLDESAQAQLQAALLDGNVEQREAGLDLLASMPQGALLARLVSAIEPESERLAAEVSALRTARQPQRRHWRALPAALAMAASVSVIAVIIVGLGYSSVHAPVNRSAEQLSAADVSDDRVLMASFESDRGNGAASAAADSEENIFRGSFGS